MDIQIRPSISGDFEDIVLLFGQLWPGKELHKDDLLAVYSEGMTGSTDSYLSAVRDGKVIAFCSMAFMHCFWQEGRIAYIYAMIVDDSLRGTGIGTRLLEEAYAVAKSHGCKKIELDSGFHREAAHKFYEKNNYVKRAFLFSKDIAR